MTSHTDGQQESGVGRQPADFPTNTRLSALSRPGKRFEKVFVEEKTNPDAMLRIFNFGRCPEEARIA